MTIMGNFSAIQGATDFATALTEANQFCLNSIANLGIAGWVFAVEEGSNLKIQNQITDNFVQSGYFIQDHMATEPMRYDIKGIVSEVELRNIVSNVSSSVARIVGITSAFTTEFTEQTKRRIERNIQSNAVFLAKYNTANNLYNEGLNLYNLALKATTLATKQAQLFAFFEALAKSGTLVSIQTQWRFLTNMIVESVQVEADQTSKGHSRFQITVKEFLVARIKENTYNPKNFADGVKMSGTKPVYNGVNIGKTHPTINVSTMKQIANNVRNVKGTTFVSEVGRVFKLWS